MVPLLLAGFVAGLVLGAAVGVAIGRLLAGRADAEATRSAVRVIGELNGGMRAWTSRLHELTADLNQEQSVLTHAVEEAGRPMSTVQLHAPDQHPSPDESSIRLRYNRAALSEYRPRVPQSG